MIEVRHKSGLSHRPLAYLDLGLSQLFTGAVPFNHSVPAAAMLAIMDNKRPPRPTHPTFTNDLWALMQHCWDQAPDSRPEVSEIVKALSGK